MLRLECQAQNYAWGRPGGPDCEVAALVAAAGGQVSPDKPYAELWMGSHPSGMSLVAGSGGTGLKAWIEQHPAALGDAVRQRFGVDLPFLFKVLSVETALSIQSHPDKALAERLHAERPQVYKDGNHKPEMAIALSDFEALCGFVSQSELFDVLTGTRELWPCLGQAAAAQAGPPQQPHDLRQLFTALMTCEQPTVEAAIQALVPRLQAEGRQRQLTAKEALVLRLHQQYGNDVGVLAAFFLNFLQLPAGQAIYLDANVPHAYVSGQIVECMATSDNVIRAGLTPKLRDTEVLCSSLTYTQALPEVLAGAEEQQYSASYRPPFDEFEVSRLQLPPRASTLLAASPGPSLLLVQGGSGLATATPGIVAERLETCPQLDKGAVFFVPAGTPVALTAGAAEPLTVWAAAVNRRVFDAAAPAAERTGAAPALVA